MKDCVFDNSPIAEMFDDDALEQLRRDAGVPHTFRIHHDDRTAGTHAKAWRLAPLHSRGAEEKSFPLQEPGQKAVQRAATTFR